MVVNWLVRHPRITDWALVLVALATLGGAAVRHGHPALEIPLALVACLPLLARRSHPLAVLAITTGATMVLVAGWDLYNPMPAGNGL